MKNPDAAVFLFPGFRQEAFLLYQAIRAVDIKSLRDIMVSER